MTMTQMRKIFMNNLHSRNHLWCWIAKLASLWQRVLALKTINLRWRIFSINSILTLACI